MDRFLIASNPLNKNSKDLYILHTLYPFILIKVMRSKGQTHYPPEMPCMFALMSGKEIPLPPSGEVPILEFVCVRHQAEPGSKEMDRVLAVMKRASRWFRSYLTENPIPNDVDNKTA